ncbi:uncharacterized protein LY89DRAFT_263232 [Mollisia scopiformis]|uniref:Antifreeze protein n=1 Tax=Mollisia scopiformis TaxID=149040 RepID=A0A132BE39_MOLSC|nr:uncharacterized protein LY89DRAFT_263232 [Mollisia scopiformis]KUJ10513.1 hypothetical protein LY89DRAFT_263232 [Mollisia scopiformis]
MQHSSSFQLPVRASPYTMLCKSLLSSIALLAATHVVNASPVAPVNSAIANAVLSAECLLVNVAVNSLHAYSSATPFCSSFIGIKTSTISTTITTTLPVVTATLITTTSTSSDILPCSDSHNLYSGSRDNQEGKEEGSNSHHHILISCNRPPILRRSICERRDLNRL